MEAKPLLLSGPFKLDSSKFVTAAAKTWFIAAMLGQWAFGIYIVMFYHASTFQGDFERWNRVLPKGYVPQDMVGNLITGVHVLLAAIIVIGGPIQFIPYMRAHFKTLHRWIGRAYVATAIIVSIAGLLLIWTRGTVGTFDMHLTNSIQAVYIIMFALLTIRYAIGKDFGKHRVWALRLFMVANGVWFFRVGLMAWLMIFQRPVGFDPNTFSGPFLSMLALFSYAVPLPLIMLEMYLWAGRKKDPTLNFTTGTLIYGFTLLMLVGIFGAIMGMWIPNIL